MQRVLHVRGLVLGAAPGCVTHVWVPYTHVCRSAILGLRPVVGFDSGHLYVATAGHVRSPSAGFPGASRLVLHVLSWFDAVVAWQVPAMLLLIFWVAA